MRSSGGFTPGRYLAIALSLGLVALAVFTDDVGLGPGPGTGRFRVIAATVATVLLTYGILGRSFHALFRGLGLILAWLAIAVLSLEIVSFAALELALSPGSAEAPGGQAEAPWFTIPQGVAYEPFVTWLPSPGGAWGAASTDGRACRAVPGASTDPEAFTVFVYGSETVFGSSSMADSASMPCFLQEALDTLCTGPVRVENRAVPGWTSDQAMIDLCIQLRDGRTPDLVLFVGGFHDAASAWRSGRSGGHPGLEVMRRSIETGEQAGGESGAWMSVLETTSTWRLIRHFIAGGDEPADATQEEAPDLADEVAGAFEANAGFAGRLGAEYGFDSRFFWLPGIWDGSRDLTPLEQETVDLAFTEYGEMEEFGDLLEAVSASVSERAAGNARIASLSSCLDQVQGQAYIGRTGLELNADGNQAVARAVLSDLGYGIQGNSGTDTP